MIAQVAGSRPDSVVHTRSHAKKARTAVVVNIEMISVRKPLPDDL